MKQSVEPLQLQFLYARLFLIFLDQLPKFAFIPEGYTFKYTEGNKVSDRVTRIDLVMDIYWRVGLQKAYYPFRLNLSSFFLVDRFTWNLARNLKVV